MKTMAGAYWDREKTKPINGVAALKWVLQNENIHTTVRISRFMKRFPRNENPG